MGPRKKGAFGDQFEGTKAYVVATVDPGHGEMDTHVDGQKLIVNTQSHANVAVSMKHRI